jgi:hypothetical protein
LPPSSPTTFGSTRPSDGVSTVAAVATMPDAVRVDALERRAIWLAALATIVLVFSSFGLGTFVFGGAEWWKVALFVAAQAALVASVGLSTLSLVPGRAPAIRIERVLLWAFVLFWLALLLSALNVSISAIQAIGESGFDG